MTEEEARVRHRGFYTQEERAKIREHMREANRLAAAEAKKRGVKLDPRIAKMRRPTPEGEG